MPLRGRQGPPAQKMPPGIPAGEFLYEPLVFGLVHELPAVLVIRLPEEGDAAAALS